MIKPKDTLTQRGVLVLTICLMLLAVFGFDRAHLASDGQKNNQNSNRRPKNSNHAPPRVNPPSLPPSKPGNTNANKPSP